MAALEHVPLQRIYTRLTTAVAAAGSQTKYAAAIGVTAQHLNDVLHARKDPGPAVLAALGLRRQVVYVEKSKGETKP